jgi:hypothetical protein
MRNAAVRGELTKMRKQLKALKKHLEEDTSLKNRKMLTDLIPSEIKRIDDMLGDSREKEVKKNVLEEVLRKQIREILKEDLSSFFFPAIRKKAERQRRSQAKMFFPKPEDLSAVPAGLQKKIEQARKKASSLFDQAVQKRGKKGFVPLQFKQEVYKAGEDYINLLKKATTSTGSDDVYANKLRKSLTIALQSMKELKSEIEADIPSEKEIASKLTKQDLSKGRKHRSCRFEEGLSLGCKGADVMSLQRALKGLGYDIKEDGFLGSKTARAYKDWAKKNDAHMGSIGLVAYNKIKKQADKFESDIISGIEKDFGMAKTRASASGQSRNRTIPIKAANIEDKKLKESKFSNDKGLQNLMESFKKFTRND